MIRETCFGILGFLAAVIIAPMILSCFFITPAHSGLADVASGCVFMLLICGPFSLILGLVFGVPTIIIAKALQIRAAWLFALGGAAAGLTMGFLDFARTEGSTTRIEILGFLVSGIGAALTYWCIAGRRRGVVRQVDPSLFE